MKERQILFSGPMVRAILDGRKTMTRRVVKWPILSHSDGGKQRIFSERDVDTINELLSDRRRHPCQRIKCPYGAPGDRLWVRETFWAKHEFGDCEYGRGPDLGPCLDLGPDFHPGIDYCATPEYLSPPKDGNAVDPHKVCEPGVWWLSPKEGWDGKSDYMNDGEWVFLPWDGFSKCPSIHMPRWASRITLDVTGVRVERVQDISEVDACAEGVSYTGPYPAAFASGFLPRPENIARREFQTLWNSINGKRAGADWASNPWVWVVEFRRVQDNG